MSMLKERTQQVLDGVQLLGFSSWPVGQTAQPVTREVGAKVGKPFDHKVGKPDPCPRRSATDKVGKPGSD